MDKVSILICQEDTLDSQLKTLKYLSKSGGKFVTIGRIIKQPKSDDTQIRSCGVVLLDIVNSTAFNLDRHIINEALQIDSNLDIRIHNKVLETRYANIKDYPCYLNAYKLYAKENPNKRVVVAKRVIEGNNVYSVMHPSERIKFGDAENGVLNIYSEKELLEKLTNIDSEIKLIGASLDDKRMTIELNKAKW